MKQFFNIFTILLFLSFITSCKDKECSIDKKELEKSCLIIDYNKNIFDTRKALVLPVYMDYQATTRIDPRVLQEMNFVEYNVYGNANSLHKMGKEALKLVEKARKQVADVIKAKPDEIIFTSGATESNNLALKGIIETYGNKLNKKHIITTTTEHACIQESCKKLEDFYNVEVTYLYPKSDGIIDLKELENAIKPNTILISIMGVNNEIGVIQDLEAIGKIAKKYGIFFHTDCAQAFGKIPLDVDKMNIDLMSISGHKIYGPKGIGALYVRKHNRGAGCVPDLKPSNIIQKNNTCSEKECKFKCKKVSNIELIPQMNGGGQENGVRSGTLAVPLIVGFGKASEIMKTDYEKDKIHIHNMSERLKKGLREIPDATLNGSETQRYEGNLNFSFKGINALTLVSNLGNKVALSIGSACGSSHSAKDSYVIKSLGIDTTKIGGAVRIGIGRFTTEEEIDYAVKEIKKEVLKIRNKKSK